ncbi:hypothetical protein AAFP35_13935 [Gordonia sp. CPCC 206044]|uniref:hypothetical protein n=1 Tax=Gordonia sp. CPCC 206044 TaxID=3140793 RepID=UPI003AF40735
MNTVTAQTRAERFARDLDEMKVSDPATSRTQLWIRLGIAAMVVGIALPVIAYFMSHNTSDPLVQRDAVILGLIGIAVTIAGAVVFLRYSLTNFLRFWLARQAFDLSTLGDRLVAEDTTSAATSASRVEGVTRDEHTDAAVAHG